MTDWLLDTNVVSELRKPRPAAVVLKWMRDTGSSHIYLSTIALAEIRLGIELLQNAAQRLELTSWLESSVRGAFAGRILDVDELVLFEWRVLGNALNKKRRTVPEPDLLLAAVARRYRMGIASRDTKHLAVTGVSTLNPWTGERFNGA